MLSENNKRIVKNTLMLYIRMFLTMLVGLYTSRIVLSALGIKDYGIYNVIGGVVVMLNFLNGALANSTQRFLNYEMGKGNEKYLSRIFSSALVCHFIIAFAFFFIAETIGLWFVRTQLVIPEERINAALWTYQFSILIFLSDIIRTPYSAVIISYEKMGIYAYLSIFEVSSKLLVAFLLSLIQFDKLKLYTSLLFLSSTISLLLYLFYCRKTFMICRHKMRLEKKIFLDIISFAGWNTMGSVAIILKAQGLSVLLNIFWGVTINAALGVSSQIQNAVLTLTNNFIVSTNPQIIKSYARKDEVYLFKLVNTSSKISFLLTSLITIPVIIEMPILLSFWLKNVPKYSAFFSRLQLIAALIESVTFPLTTLSLATGKAKTYFLWSSGILLLILPVSYVFLKMGFLPQSCLYVVVCFYLIILVVRLILSKKLANFCATNYMFKVIFPLVLYFLVSMILSILIKKIVNIFFVDMVIYGFILFAVAWMILDVEEKSLAKNYLKEIFTRI